MWFNNCVGQRNYKYFFVSIISTFSYALIVVVQVILTSFSVDFSNKNQLIRIILSWAIASVLAVLGFMLLNLIILHIYLLITDQTTYQFLQRKKKEEEM
jgi:palmitoyltransferase ZDHHC9/14/18